MPRTTRTDTLLCVHRQAAKVELKAKTEALATNDRQRLQYEAIAKSKQQQLTQLMSAKDKMQEDLEAKAKEAVARAEKAEGDHGRCRESTPVSMVSFLVLILFVILRDGQSRGPFPFSCNHCCHRLRFVVSLLFVLDHSEGVYCAQGSGACGVACKAIPFPYFILHPPVTCVNAVFFITHSPSLLRSFLVSVRRECNNSGFWEEKVVQYRL